MLGTPRVWLITPTLTTLLPQVELRALLSGAEVKYTNNELTLADTQELAMYGIALVECATPDHETTL